MKKIMILGASILQLPAIKQAKEMGLRVITVDMNPKAIGFNVDGVLKETISTNDIPAVLQAAKRHKIDGIMTLASDMPMRTVAKVASEMGLVGINEETAYKATNKTAMRRALGECGIPIPVYYKVTNEEEFFEAVYKLRNCGYKIIVKPADNSGSRGVSFISEYTNEKLKAIYKYSKLFSHSGELVVEEFMEGPEVSVETLSVGGEYHIIQITDKLTTGAPCFVEMGHSQPSQLDKKIQDAIKMVTIAANEAIGITNGPSHTEIKVTSEGPKIVEIGARLGGDNIATHLVPLSSGINMVEACIKLSLGETPDFEYELNAGSAIRYLPQTSGIVKNIIGIEKARMISGVKEITIIPDIGEMIEEVKSSSARMGYVISQGNDAEDAIEICENALKCISVEIEEKK